MESSVKKLRRLLKLWIRYSLHVNKIACGNQFSSFALIKTIHLEHFVESGHRHQKRVPAEVPDHVPW